MNKLRKKRPGGAGFTLIEMIVVIAVLGIIAVIAIPKYSSYVDSAKQETDRQTAAVAVNAMAMYCAEYNIKTVTETLDSTEEWMAALNAAGLWLTADQTLKSDYYTGIILSGPEDGVCTVTLEGETDYVISK